jgi:ABC-type multidrug transport system ATPase subunit
LGNLLEASNLGKRYGSRWLFRALSFELGSGDYLVIRGANGSGKSTLVKALAGLVELTQGSVAWTGDPRLCLGYAALDMAVYPHLSPAEHLRMAADLRGLATGPVPSGFGLEGCQHTRGGGLSTGQRMRLKMAIATQTQPSVLILDEPGASLDEAGHELVDRLISEQLSRGCVIIATNNPAEGKGANLEIRLDD